MVALELTDPNNCTVLSPELRLLPGRCFSLGSLAVCGLYVMLLFLGVQKSLEARISGSRLPGSSFSRSQPCSHTSALCVIKLLPHLF